MSWFKLWLILHILAVIIAFGPTFAFGIIAALGQKDPRHAAFASKVSHTIETRMVIPVAVLVPLFGTALIFTGHHDLWHSEWLLAAIGLYIVAFSFAVLVQNRWSTRMLKTLSDMPPGPPPEGAAPPAEVMALGRKLQMGGMFLGILIVVILVLMVWKPGDAFSG